MASGPRLITGTEFMDWLEERGIIPAATRRVVIDATMEEAVVIYVEQLGSSEMIAVDPPAILPAQVRILEDHHDATDDHPGRSAL